MSSFNLKDLRILVVEDEEDLRSVLVGTLKRKGALVFSATNGLEAYESFQREPVDLVISDVQMPLCNGVELLEKIRKRHPSVPLVFLATGFADLSEPEALILGASALIAKPFALNVLIAKIEAAFVSLDPNAIK